MKQKDWKKGYQLDVFINIEKKPKWYCEYKNI